MWNLIQQIAGVNLAGMPTPERLMLMAIAGTGIMMLITSALSMMTNIGRRR